MQVSNIKYGIETTVGAPSLQAAIDRVKDALKAEGFGVLCEIDVAKTLKEKIGAEIPATVILGACNPPLAHQALQAEPHLALLLPCNVVVSAADDGRFRVSAIDAGAMLSLVENPALDPIAREVNERFGRVLAAMA